MAASPKQKILKELYSMMASGNSRDRYASILTRLALDEQDRRPHEDYWRRALMAHLSKGASVRELPEVPEVASPFH